MTSTATLPVADKTDTKSDDPYAHYVASDGITEAYVFGTPLIALCGRVFIPTRDPEKYPVCPDCKDIHDSLLE